MANSAWSIGTLGEFGLRREDADRVDELAGELLGGLWPQAISRTARRSVKRAACRGCRTQRGDGVLGGVDHHRRHRDHRRVGESPFGVVVSRVAVDESVAMPVRVRGHVDEVGIVQRGGALRRTPSRRNATWETTRPRGSARTPHGVRPAPHVRVRSAGTTGTSTASRGVVPRGWLRRRRCPGSGTRTRSRARTRVPARARRRRMPHAHPSRSRRRPGGRARALDHRTEVMPESRLLPRPHRGVVDEPRGPVPTQVRDHDVVPGVDEKPDHVVVSAWTVGEPVQQTTLRPFRSPWRSTATSRTPARTVEDSIPECAGRATRAA